MNSRRSVLFWTLLVVLSMVLSACAVPAQSPGGAAAGGQASTGAGRKTEVGTPREQTLIVDSLDGRIDNPTQMNPYQASTRFNTGYHQLCLSNMWDMNTVTGKQFGGLAADLPKPLNKDYTQFEVKLRPGLAWSDGQPLTTDDVAYTIDMVLQHKDFPYNGFLSQVIKEYKVIDPQTIQITTQKPDPRLGYTLGVTVWGDAFRVIPKHVFEKQQDPVKFTFYPPVCSGPYKFKDADPNGYWYLWEKRDDWAKSDAGMIAGEPKPQYILFRFYGPEEKRIIAGIQHDLDIFTDIVPESWDVLRQKNPNAKAWYTHFPWANLDDPCERGITFVNTQAPFDKPEVRWALALATDMQAVSMATFGGKLRASPLPVPPISVLQKTYHQPMRQWLMDFALPDGYKPFDPDFAKKMAATLSKQGMEGIPTDEKEIVDMFGVGWWKYDPDKAAQLLESVGFKKGADGKWMTPDGKPWQFTINAPNNFEVESQRLAFAVADSWRKFGIDVNVQQMEAGSFWNAWNNGTFQAGSYWPGCGVAPDVWDNMNTQWHIKYVVPTGQPAPGNQTRYSNQKLSDILDQVQALPSDDPKTIELLTEFMKGWIADMPWLPMFGTSKFVPVDTYYWKNFPTSDNYYEGPWWWWSLFKYIVPKFEPTGNK